MGSAREAIAFFDPMIGVVKEDPAHSNCTIVTRTYGPIGSAKCYAWCCAGCWYVLTRTGTRFPKTAQVLDASKRAKRGEMGLTWIPRDGHIEQGDLPCFDWKGNGNPADMHISMVRNPGTQDRFETNGCNENDMAFRQWRDRTFVFGFIRPAYDSAPAPQPQKEWDDMASKEEVKAALAEVLGEQPFNLDGVNTYVGDMHDGLLPGIAAQLGILPQILDAAKAAADDDAWVPTDADVNKIASAISTQLGDDVAKRVGERLANG